MLLERLRARALLNNEKVRPGSHARLGGDRQVLQTAMYSKAREPVCNTSDSSHDMWV